MFQRMDKRFCSRYISRYGDIVHVAETQQPRFVRLSGLGCNWVPEKQKEVYFITCDTRGNLLVAALKPAEELKNCCPVLPVAQRLCRLKMPQ